MVPFHKREAPIFFPENLACQSLQFCNDARANEKHVLFLQGSALPAHPANRMRGSALFCSPQFTSRADNNDRGGNRRHSGRSAERLRRASGTFPKPFFQRSKCLRTAAVVVFLRRTV